MPVYKIKSICLKLYEDDSRVEVLDKKTGIIDIVYKSQNESKYNYYLKKDDNFYILKTVNI
jgi:hypothetical protein